MSERFRYYATVRLTVHIELDLRGKEPTVANLCTIARSQVSDWTERASRDFGGCSYGTPEVTAVQADLEEGGS